MKKTAIFLIINVVSFLTYAQELPVPSPFSKVEQRVGLTDFTIEYSRPSTKGRKIFGGLESYNEIWRLGANECTKLTSSTPFTFGDVKVEAGTYAMFAIPMEEDFWTIILNTDTEQWGSSNYDSTKNVAKINVRFRKGDLTETLSIGLRNLTNDRGTITITWSELIIDIPFQVDTEGIVNKNIDTAISAGKDLDKVYYKAASYTFKTVKHHKKALIYLEKSLDIKTSYRSLYLKAQIIEDEGDKGTAIKIAKAAKLLAEQADKQGWADYIEKSIDKWSKE